MSEPWEDVDTGGKGGIEIGSPPSGGRLQGVSLHLGRVHALLLLDAELLLAAGRTSWGSYSLPDPQQRAVAGAGQTVSTRLLTRRAGVHVDFHAHRHFHNLRSFPTHQASPKQCWHDVRAGIKTRLTSNVAQARNIRP